MSATTDTNRLEFRLDDILTEQDLSYAELARRTGIKPSSLSDLKKGRHKLPRAENIVLICDELQITPGDLFKITPKNNS